MARREANRKPKLNISQKFSATQKRPSLKQGGRLLMCDLSRVCLYSNTLHTGVHTPYHACRLKNKKKLGQKLWDFGFAFL